MTENIIASIIEDILSKVVDLSTQPKEEDMEENARKVRQPGEDEYAEGQIVMARMRKSSWWPALIKKDPVTDVPGRSTRTGWEYHVGFIGESKSRERAWVNKSRIMNILSIKDFKSQRAQLSKGDSKQRVCPDDLNAFDIMPKDIYRWTAGMKAAEITKTKQMDRESTLAEIDEIQNAINENVDMMKNKTTKKKITKKRPLDKKCKSASSSAAKRCKMDTEVRKTSRQMDVEQRNEEEKKKKEEAGPGWEYILELFVPKVKVEAKREGFKKEPCCQICHAVSQTEGDLLKCCNKGSCGATYHKSCLKIEEVVEEEKWTCSECVNSAHVCFICKSTDLGTDSASENMKSTKLCISSGCSKWYHEKCVTNTVLWPQTEKSGRGFTCPAHMCHSCAAEDIKHDRHPVMKYTDKLLQCIKCPTSYHDNEFCTAAGTLQISKSVGICPKHDVPPKSAKKKGGKFHTNINWCLQCSNGGDLICCEMCAISYHANCLSENTITEGDNFYCEDCESGRKPLQGEVVWTRTKYKSGYRWWPVEVLPWPKVPDNIENVKHREGQFPVRYLGENKYAWLSHGQVFLYNEGDDERIPTKGQTADVIFKKALVEAEELNKMYVDDKALREGANKDKVLKKGQRKFKPNDYRKIRLNKPYGTCKTYTQDITECNCKPDDEDPCGANSDCFNRAINEECSPKHCPAGKRCANQRLQNRQYASWEVIGTNDRGSGLRAKKDIKEGDLIVEYMGEVITENELEIRKERDVANSQAKYYYIALDYGRVIDAGLMGNEARFANHSCDPNAGSIKWDIQGGDTRIGLYAKRDILAGDEITFGYWLSAWVEEEKDMMKCLCQTSICSGFIGKQPLKKEAIDEDKEKGEKMKKTKIKPVKKGEKTKKNKNDPGEKGEKTKKNQNNPGEKGEKTKKKLVKNVKTKKRKRSEMVQGEKFWEYVCNRCDEPGHEDVKCEDGACPKVYHLKCARLESLPEGSWSCPWHSCNVCKKRVDGPDAMCRFCPNAYCKLHEEGNLMPISRSPAFSRLMDMPSKELGTMCKEHQGQEEMDDIAAACKLPTTHPTRKQITAYKKAYKAYKDDESFSKEYKEENKENKDEESTEEITSLEDNSKKSQGNPDHSASARQSLSTVRL